MEDLFNTLSVKKKKKIGQSFKVMFFSRLLIKILLETLNGGDPSVVFPSWYTASRVLCGVVLCDTLCTRAMMLKWSSGELCVIRA